MTTTVYLAAIGYRILAIAAGFGFAFFGYRLFRLGVFERAGDLKAAWGDRKLALKQAAPGTFFAVSGVIVVCVSLWRQVELSDEIVRKAGADRSNILDAWEEQNEVATAVEQLLDAGAESLDESKKQAIREWVERHKQKIVVEQKAQEDPDKKAA